jgi:hypothetical protein
MSPKQLRAIGVIVAILGSAGPAAGQLHSSQTSAPARPASPSAHLLDGLKVAAGGVLGLALHESGHVMMGLAFNAHPHTHRAYIGGLPFFAIVHRGGLSPTREYAIAAAGFWMQGMTNERLLAQRAAPGATRATLSTGVFAFNELASLGYGIVALARAGPATDRVIDTRGMAHALHVNEPLIGGLILAPALIDGYRYLHPDVRWAKWASRVAKTGTVLLLLK